MSMPLLDVRDLTVEFATRNGIVRAIDSVSLSVNKGEILGVGRRVRLREVRHILCRHAYP